MPSDQFSKQNSPENKRINFELDIEGEKISCIREEFEYPNNIKKETGILGYERTIISKEVLQKIHEKTGGESGTELTKEILDKLSGGEFFDLARHEMGWYAKDDNLKDLYVDKFKDQKFILQKIFDVNAIEELKQETKSSIFSHPNDAGNNTIKFSIFNKNTLQVVKEDISPKQLPEYKGGFASGELFSVTTKSGLSERNILSGQGKTTRPPNLFYDKFFLQRMKELGREVTSEFPQNPIFAFDPTEPHLHEYFLEVYKLFIELNKANHTNIVGDETDIFYNLYQKINYKALMKKEKDGDVSVQLRHDFMQDVDDLEKDPAYLRKNISNSRSERDEGSIPVVISHEKIRQLSWGDSKYAVFFTEKGLNFLKIKHADHLPAKSA